jgi:hypothetical protein
MIVLARIAEVAFAAATVSLGVATFVVMLAVTA